MFNKRIVIPGLLIFVLFVTFPFWYNGLSAGPMPKPELPPGGEKECVAPVSEMRAKHMKLLNEWRDEVLREGKRGVITVNGVEYNKSLQMACMECHSNKDKFCNECHEYVDVTPKCWSCHITPADIEAKNKETH